MSDMGPPQQYSAFLEEGLFMIQRSRESGKYFFHPRTLEPGTGCTDLEWVAPSGYATVYSTTTIRQRPPLDDYNLAIFDLDEGPRMLGRVVGIAPDKVSIGMRVKSKIIREEEKPMVVFELLESD
jgi:uncharacterized protein